MTAYINAANQLMDSASRTEPFYDAANQLMGPAAFRDTPAYDPAAQAFFERLTTQPTDARKALYNTLIVSLKDAGVWAKLDALYVLAAADAQAARQNLVADAYNLGASGSPVFTGDRGYAGDGVGAYLNTGAVPASLAKFKQNDASIWSWANTNAQDASNDFGTLTGATILLKPYTVIGARVDARLNQSVTNNTGVVATSLGLTGSTRPDSLTQTVFRNAVILQTFSQFSVAPEAVQPITFLQGGGAYSARRLAAGGFGASLTSQNLTDMYAALNAYLSAIGAN